MTIIILVPFWAKYSCYWIFFHLTICKLCLKRRVSKFAFANCLENSILCSHGPWYRSTSQILRQRRIKLSTVQDSAEQKLIRCTTALSQFIICKDNKNYRIFDTHNYCKFKIHNIMYVKYTYTQYHGGRQNENSTPWRVYDPGGRSVTVSPFYPTVYSRYSTINEYFFYKQIFTFIRNDDQEYL